MIDEYYTWIIFGYHSDEITHGSTKRVVVVCDECGMYRVTAMHDYYDLCISCGQKTSPTNDDGDHVCRVCGVALVAGDNTTLYRLNTQHIYICRTCSSNEAREWNHITGRKTSYVENKECAMFLGVHVAERVLSHVFKNVATMPYGNEGYDFVCGNGFKIDVKSACRRSRYDWSDSWGFSIHKNQIADYFLCLAFDNRTNLSPEYMWLIPGNVVNDRISISISESTLDRWGKYKIPIDKVVDRCNEMKNGDTK